MNRIYVFIVFISFAMNMNAQVCSFKQDTVYFVQINAYQKNARPLYAAGIIHSLNELIYKKYVEDFLCTFYVNAFFIHEPSFSFVRMRECYSDTNIFKSQYLSFFEKLFGELNKPDYDSSFYVSMKKKSSVNISIIKIIGEFWTVPVNFGAMQNTMHTYKVEKNCYPHPIFYEFKRIIKVEKISQADRLFLANVFPLG